jgi:hypothetical protein
VPGTKPPQLPTTELRANLPTPTASAIRPVPPKTAGFPTRGTPRLKPASTTQSYGPGLPRLLSIEDVALLLGVTVADLNAICCVFYLRSAMHVLNGKPSVRAWYEAGMGRPTNRAAFAMRGE